MTFEWNSETAKRLAGQLLFKRKLNILQVTTAVQSACDSRWFIASSCVELGQLGSLTMIHLEASGPRTELQDGLLLHRPGAEQALLDLAMRAAYWVILYKHIVILSCLQLQCTRQRFCSDCPPTETLRGLQP